MRSCFSSISGKKALALSFESRPKSTPIKIQFLHVDLVPQPWSECTSCGDIAGQQEQLLECRVKFVYPQGDQVTYKDRYREAGSDGLNKVQRFIDSTNRRFMADYDEKMTMGGLIRTCILTGVNDMEKLQPCQEKMYNVDDLGFNNGTSCRSLLHLNW